MPAPSPFEIACTKEAMGGPWPDLSAIAFKAPAVVAPVETRACVGRQRPVTGGRCDHCRAHQDTYGAHTTRRRSPPLAA